jgi:lipoprotein-releasing system permease protein
LNFPLYIAKRYLFAKKSHNAINIISAISLAGVTIGTMALIIVLSVFNGFDQLIQTLFNSFDPDLRITVVEGKSFQTADEKLDQLSAIPGVVAWSKVIEENALLKYGDKQYIATIKGVDKNYSQVNNLDSCIIEGRNVLEDEKGRYAVIGQGVQYYLQVGLKFINPLMIYVPRKSATISMNPENAFNQKYIYPSGVFNILQDYDSKYVLVPISFARELLDDSLSITALEIRTAENTNVDQIQEKVQQLFGTKFSVKNRYQQKELFYRIMKYEKWAIFMILTFILAIASFNIVGSLSMLIIEKKKDISTLHSIGADRKFLRRVFLYEGTMISFFGAFLGLIIGLIVCWLQIKYGIVKFPSSGSFIINSYPVEIKAVDVVFVLITVLVIGYLAAWYPVKYIIKRYLPESQFVD